MPPDNPRYVILEDAAESLRKRARLYQLDDGSPGPMGGVWGWRVISRYLHFEADRLTDPDGAKLRPIR